MLFLYPLEPQPKDCVDTPEGNLESGAVVPRQMEESTAPTDQRCFDRATSRHVYIPWSLIHEIFCQTRRLPRSSCDAPVAGSWSASPRTSASAGCPFPHLSQKLTLRAPLDRLIQSNSQETRERPKVHATFPLTIMASGALVQITALSATLSGRSRGALSI